MAAVDEAVEQSVTFDELLKGLQQLGAKLTRNVSMRYIYCNLEGCEPVTEVILKELDELVLEERIKGAVQQTCKNAFEISAENDPEFTCEAWGDLFNGVALELSDPNRLSELLFSDADYTGGSDLNKTVMVALGLGIPLLPNGVATRQNPDKPNELIIAMPDGDLGAKEVVALDIPQSSPFAENGGLTPHHTAEKIIGALTETLSADARSYGSFVPGEDGEASEGPSRQIGAPKL